jgi:phosphohistidine phosphatase
MKLYFLRHTDAEDGIDDADRPLSPMGRQQAEALGDFCRRAGVNLDGAFASPLLRARQTADLFLRACGTSKEIRLETADELLNETSDESFADFLDRLRGRKHVLLVGHAPVLAARVRALLGMDDAALRFSKGALACVRTEDCRIGTLKFLISPKVLAV